MARVAFLLCEIFIQTDNAKTTALSHSLHLVKENQRALLRLADFPKKASREIFWVTWRDLEDRTSKIWDGGAHRLGLRLNKAIPYKGSDVEAILVGIQT